ncbi:hypothetical protein DL93DRAFT_2168837 [Clavulina sp. PMI_390]|nr:hypothetical protein DL93DRAFT_2168837 [Clavulina sp. PMI_390]
MNMTGNLRGDRLQPERTEHLVLDVDDIIPFPEDIPPEIHWIITTFLPLSDLKNYALASRHFHIFALPYLWMSIKIVPYLFYDCGPGFYSNYGDFVKFATSHPHRRWFVHTRHLIIIPASIPSRDLRSVLSRPHIMTPDQTIKIFKENFNNLTSVTLANDLHYDDPHDHRSRTPPDLIKPIIEGIVASHSPLRVLNCCHDLGSIFTPYLSKWANSIQWLNMSVSIEVEEKLIERQLPRITLPSLRFISSSQISVIAQFLRFCPNIQVVHLWWSMVSSSPIADIELNFGILQSSESRLTNPSSPSVQRVILTIQASAYGGDIPRAIRAIPKRFPLLIELSLNLKFPRPYPQHKLHQWNTLDSFVVEEFKRLVSLGSTHMHAAASYPINVNLQELLPSLEILRLRAELEWDNSGERRHKAFSWAALDRSPEHARKHRLRTGASQELYQVLCRDSALTTLPESLQFVEISTYHQVCGSPPFGSRVIETTPTTPYFLGRGRVAASRAEACCHVRSWTVTESSSDEQGLRDEYVKYFSYFDTPDIGVPSQVCPK